MAYLIGLVTKEEEAELASRGWEIMVPPKDFHSEVDEMGMRHIMIYVDTDLIKIMNGPDWRSCEHTPYSLGWSAGYNDENAECPYPEDSLQAEEWQQGYVEGSNDC
jgi:hypothetical protein